ncbi:MAG: hypothetical protein NT154_05085 [Verrucomicrobia bacterium]|nr:hypothetical protein [Verrucomicrobiota bacterium]
MKIKHTLAALSVAALTLAGTGFAAEEQDDTWRFGATVPLWAPQINGNVTIKGHQQNVDISFDQLKDHLDASFALGLEVRKEKFGFFGDVGYMKFSGGSDGMSDDLKFLIVDAGAFYRLLKTEEEHPFILEATAGLRYWGTKNEFSLRGPGGIIDFSGSKDRDLEDPVIGLRGSKFLTSKLHLDFAGDVGGFGISDSQAEWDWSVTGLVSYDFAKWFTLSAGYKALALDASKGGGENKNGVDVIFNGFLVAAKFSF